MVVRRRARSEGGQTSRREREVAEHCQDVKSDDEEGDATVLNKCAPAPGTLSSEPMRKPPPYRWWRGPWAGGLRLRPGQILSILGWDFMGKRLGSASMCLLGAVRRRGNWCKPSGHGHAWVGQRERPRRRRTESEGSGSGTADVVVRQDACSCVLPLHGSG